MKLFSLLSFLCLLSIQTSYAGGGLIPANARSSAMGNVGVMFADHYSLMNKPAGMAYWNHHSFGGSYENKFMMPELAAMAVGINVPMFNGAMGLTASSYGYNLYGEQNIGLAYAKILSEQFAIGLKFNYFMINQGAEYDNFSGLVGEIGIMSSITDELRLGAHIYNLNRAKISDYQNERVPTIMRLGLSYQMNDKVQLCLEAEKNIDAKASIKMGMDYQALDPLFVRCGIQTNPTILTFGFGLQWKSFMLDFSTTQHAVLGYSPNLGLVYTFGRHSDSDSSNEGGRF